MTRLTVLILCCGALFLVGCDKKTQPKTPAKTTDQTTEKKDTPPKDVKKDTPKEDTKTKDKPKDDKAPKMAPLRLKVISPDTDATKENPLPFKNSLKFEDRTLHVYEYRVCKDKSDACLRGDFLLCKPKKGKHLVRVGVLVNNTSKETIKHPIYPIMLELEDGSSAAPSLRCPLVRSYSSLDPVKPGMPGYLTYLFEISEKKTPKFLKYKQLKRSYYFKLTEDKKTP